MRVIQIFNLYQYLKVSRSRVQRTRTVFIDYSCSTLIFLIIIFNNLLTQLNQKGSLRFLFIYI